MHRFCFISKYSEKRMILQKKCIVMLPTLALIVTRRKKAGFNEMDLKKQEVPAIFIRSYPISACAVYATSSSIRSNEAHKSVNRFITTTANKQRRVVLTFLVKSKPVQNVLVICSKLVPAKRYL